MRRQIAARLFEAFERADLVEALPDLAGGQLAPAEKRLVQRRQIMRHGGRNVVERTPAEDAEAVVEVAHARSSMRLVVGQDPPVCKLDIASVPPVLISEDRHERALVVFHEDALYGPIVAR